MLSHNGLLKRSYARALTLWRDNSPAGRHIAAKRAATDRILNELARSTQHRFDGRVLVDAMWDNPNYWLRFTLLRAGLGLAHGHEIGLLGQYRRSQCRTTLEAFEIRDAVSFSDAAVPRSIESQAAALVAATRRAEDVLHWELPCAVHPSIMYDALLKSQRLATLDVTRSDFPGLVANALRSIARGKAILDQARPDLVVISHPLNITYGSLAWQALSRGIPVVLPYGLFGMCRFVRFAHPAELFAFYDRPTRAEMDDLPEQKAAAMANVGRRYLKARLSGQADDLASLFAFQHNADSIDREGLCERNGWDPRKPIVAVYASNWFDWPHQLGMTQFRDFLDWTEATFAAAAANTQVNWLFKPHPAEDWFGGVSLADILKKVGNAPNVALAEKRWNNTQVMLAVDALVTYHGTAGIEFASLGKPVLVPDRGKYDDCGFVKLARSRADYLSLLAGCWWSEMDLDDARRRAEIFAGWWFCAPDWQGEFLLSDDSRQDTLYDTIPPLIADHPGEIARELETLREWWGSGHRYYHTTKMWKADAFRLTNID